VEAGQASWQSNEKLTGRATNGGKMLSPCLQLPSGAKAERLGRAMMGKMGDEALIPLAQLPKRVSIS